MPTVHTVAVRNPATITGSASGSSTERSRCASVMPTASAARNTFGSTERIPTTVFRNIGKRL